MFLLKNLSGVQEGDWVRLNTGHHNIAVVADSFGAGNVTIEWRLINDPKDPSRTGILTNGVFTTNKWVYMGVTRPGVEVRAITTDAGASNVVVELLGVSES
jgi:hypothetical protein